MSDIVVINRPEDRARAMKIVDALLAKDLAFRWETFAPGSESMADATGKAVCVALLFSRDSLADTRYIAFAQAMLHAGQAIGATLDRIALPPSLAGMTVIDLSQYRSSLLDRIFKSDLYLIDFIEAARAKVADRDPPPQRGPISLRTQQVWAVAVSVFAIASLGIGFVSDVFGMSSGLSGFFSRFDHAQSVAYAHAATCDDLRDFRRAHPTGYFADKASLRLDNAKTTTAQQWTPSPQKLELYTSRDGLAPAATRDAARQTTLARLKVTAEDKCSIAAQQLGGRFMSVSLDIHDGDWTCDTLAAGQLCALATTVTCQIDAPQDIAAEDCSGGQE